MSFSNETSPRQLKGVIDRASSTGGKKMRKGNEREVACSSRSDNSVAFPICLFPRFP